MRILAILAFAFSLGFTNSDENLSIKDKNSSSKDGLVKRDFFSNKDAKDIKKVKIPTH
ncbi:hypothetical protein [Campylobacter corcagiensis]|uniref:Uncharacterized protein n=1 Tax=Campylobacter corcagiensis TaxID=1448857 RepID=A0A7M1LHI6_9BACT|nr:hypothetical protein [Campylobacter corcagiensis]QKF65377.1 hypothetical protein CCORG_1540 [Campylobacter corcagiensis]QOQ88047.1 hypothetical protein IMC76_04450 [Campylobacter corcagiensis]